MVAALPVVLITPPLGHQVAVRPVVLGMILTVLSVLPRMKSVTKAGVVAVLGVLPKVLVKLHVIIFQVHVLLFLDVTLIQAGQPGLPVHRVVVLLLATTPVLVKLNKVRVSARIPPAIQ